jgi:hypothetical protein
MFRLITIFFLTAISPTLFAEEQIWKFGKVFIKMYEDQNKNAVYSFSCNQSPCDALKKSNKVSFKTLEKNALLGGKNPGSVLCKENLKMDIVFMKDLAGNENSFCLFKDKSMISASSLAFMARENDLKKSGGKK